MCTLSACTDVCILFLIKYDKYVCAREFTIKNGMVLKMNSNMVGYMCLCITWTHICTVVIITAIIHARHLKGVEWKKEK